MLQTHLHHRNQSCAHLLPPLHRPCRQPQLQPRLLQHHLQPHLQLRLRQLLTKEITTTCLLPPIPPNFMDVDTPPASSDNPMQSEDELPHRNQLQEDTEDSDGVPVSRMYHPLLDGIVNLLYLIFNY